MLKINKYIFFNALIGRDFLKFLNACQHQLFVFLILFATGKLEHDLKLVQVIEPGNLSFFRA